MEICHTAVRAGRLSGILRGEMGLSAGLMNRLKWRGALLVNGQPVHTDYAVQPGDMVTAVLCEPEPQYPAEDAPVSVLYEDDFLLAVDKPAGMLVHPSRVQQSGTLANAVLGYYRRTGQSSAFHPATRLDRDTFGIVLLAKNSHVHACLNALHSAGGLEKTYHALTFGCPETQSGIIDAPIARRAYPSLLREIRADGKPSRTAYTVLERRGACALLALHPLTGRTHQLRLHCAYNGFPILGDPQYGSAASCAYSAMQGFAGQMLCAVSLSFLHPVTGERLTITARQDVSLAQLRDL